MRSIAAAALLAAALATGALAEESRPDWWEAQRDNVTRLLSADLDAVLASVEGEPQTVQETLRRLDLAVRAGRHAAVRRAIERLSRFDALARSGVLDAVADDLIDREEDDLARFFLERHPRAKPGWGYVFVRRWVEREDAGIVDAWMAERQAASWGFWARERLRLSEAEGTTDARVAECAEEVRRRPRDAQRALEYLSALHVVSEPPDLDWMGATCRPPLATDTAEIGSRLVDWAPAAAVALLERAHGMELVAADRERLRRQRPVWIESVERSFRLGVERDLVRALQNAGRLEEAQRALERLTEALEKGGEYLPLARLSGRVQATTGGRTIERRVLAAEAEDRDSPAYWQRRREYYTGRGQLEKALEAARRELALCPHDTLLDRSGQLPPKSKADRPGTLEAQRRHRTLALRHMADLLARLGRHREAIDVLVNEIAVRPAAEDFTAPLARRAAELLAEAKEARTERHERVLWQLVVSTEAWDHCAPHVLRALFDHPGAGGLPDRPWERLEDAAKGADPRRGIGLASVLRTRGDHDREIRVLEEVYRRLEPGEVRSRAGSSLFWTLQDIGRWEDAERYWPDRLDRLTPRETTDNAAVLAESAAKAGALEDAMRLWRRVANLDRTRFRGLDVLAEAGLRDRLVTLYEGMAKHDPDSVAPVRALAILAATED